VAHYLQHIHISGELVIVVHHHGVDAKFNYGRILYLQTPNKQYLQQTTEQVYSRPSKGFKKALYPVGRSHLFHIGLNVARVTFAFGKLIKIGQMSARTVDHKAQNLFEDFEDRQTLFIFSYCSKKSVNQNDFFLL
jgi:hypothetical protein